MNSLIQACLSVLYMVLILVTIPLAFDVGGVDCGLDYTFTLVVYYLVMSSLRIVTRNTKLSVLGSMFYYSQHIVLPSLLVLHLAWAQQRSITGSGNSAAGLTFGSGGLHHAVASSVSASVASASSTAAGWFGWFRHGTSSFASSVSSSSSCPKSLKSSSQANVAAAFPATSAYNADELPFKTNVVLVDQFLGLILTYWDAIVTPWRLLVNYSTPLFTIMEGFCTLLCIQATGQITRWLIKRNDLWMLVQLAFSGSFLSGSLYFLYRIYCFPQEVDLASFIMVSIVLISALSLGLYGIVSGRGAAIESSLLFSYVVYCIYLLFTDFDGVRADTQGWSFSSFLTGAGATSSSGAGYIEDLPPLPPIFMTGYSNIMANLAEMIPQSFITVGEFFFAIISTISPSVFFSLFYRLFVIYATTRIIPALRKANANDRVDDTVDDRVDDRVPEDQDQDQDQDDQYQYHDNDNEHEKEKEDDADTLVEPEPSVALASDASVSDDTKASRLKESSRQRQSKSKPILFLVYAYAPCIIIAEYTHLIMQHIERRNTPEADLRSSAFSVLGHCWFTQNDLFGISVASWQFWGWMNTFTFLILYALELVYGKTNNGGISVH